MTPKEKAIDLFNKFHYDKVLYHELGLCHSRQCALIAVDEIISNIEPSVSMDIISARIKYWEQVKEEINKLWV